MTSTEGELPEQSKEALPARSTLDNVAALAGVSAKTASRALNEHAGVSDKTRQKVLEAAQMLRFRPNGLAKELRTGGVSGGVGLVIADLANPFYSQLAAAAEKKLRERGLELFLASTNEDPQREREVVRTMLDRRVRALLLVPASEDHSYLQFEKSLGTPIVFLDRPPRILSTDMVLSDNRQASFEVVQALIDAGHKRIAVVGDEQSAWTARERLEGAREALRAGGAPGWERYVGINAHDPGEARTRTLELLALDEPPTAIFALNNLITVGVLMALRDSAADVTVTGFDDSEMADLLGISVVALDPAEMGRRGAELAINRMDGLSSPPEEVILPTRMIERTPLDAPIRLVASPRRDRELRL